MSPPVVLVLTIASSASWARARAAGNQQLSAKAATKKETVLLMKTPSLIMDEVKLQYYASHPASARTGWTAAWLGAAGSPLSDPSTPPAVVIYMSIACHQGLSEQTPKKRLLHNSLSRRSFRGRGDRIRTYDLLTPSQTLCQAELRPVKFAAGSREPWWPCNPKTTRPPGSPGNRPRSGKYTVSGGFTKEF